jgi:hypothetical protein
MKSSGSNLINIGGAKPPVAQPPSAVNPNISNNTKFKVSKNPNSNSEETHLND